MPDFAPAEYRARLDRAQRAMVSHQIDALLLSTEAEVRYFSGFRTLFWQSPTRSWFLVVPATGDPIAVIPAIGAELMASTWVRDIRTFAAPTGGTEGLDTLRDALSGYGHIAMPMGEESSLRMAPAEFDMLRATLQADWSDATPLIKALRMVKSEAEITLIHRICKIGSQAFARGPDLFSEGQPLTEVFRAFKIALLQAGAEDVPYLVGGAGSGGYGDVISPPSDRPLATGDILMLDTGASLAGYFCDFDRNWAIGQASAEAQDAYRTLWHATEAGIAAARAGVTASELCDVIGRSLGVGSDIGRMGHGLGMQLTEWPSLAGHDQTVLEPGMVITLEPSLALSQGRMMVHEENILITDGAPELLTQRAPRELQVI